LVIVAYLLVLEIGDPGWKSMPDSATAIAVGLGVGAIFCRAVARLPKPVHIASAFISASGSSALSSSSKTEGYWARLVHAF